MLKKLIVAVSIAALILQCVPVFAAQPGKGGPRGDNRSDFHNDGRGDPHKDYRKEDHGDKWKDHRRDPRKVVHREVYRDVHRSFHRDVFVHHLPRGYVTYWIGDLIYFFFGGFFYRPAPGGYVMVEQPVRAVPYYYSATPTPVVIQQVPYYLY